MTTLRDTALALLIVVAVVAVIRFEKACLEDLANTPDFELKLLTRLGSTAFILFSIPIGGVCYRLSGTRR